MCTIRYNCVAYAMARSKNHSVRSDRNACRKKLDYQAALKRGGSIRKDFNAF